MFAEDESAYLEDFGSPVIFGALTTWAIFDQPDADALSGRVQTTEYKITYPKAKLPGLKNGDQLLIGLGAGWSFDCTGRRLQYNGRKPEPDSGIFQVLGVPDKVEDGVFLQASLERIS